MKTLEHPINPNAERSYRIRCVNRHCKALMELSFDELNYDKDPANGDRYWFICPHCQKQVSVATEVLASKQWHKANIEPIR